MLTPNQGHFHPKSGQKSTSNRSELFSKLTKKVYLVIFSGRSATVEKRKCSFFTKKRLKLIDCDGLQGLADFLIVEKFDEKMLREMTKNIL